MPDKELLEHGIDNDRGLYHSVSAKHVRTRRKE